MKQHIQTLINLLTTNDLTALHQHYLDSNESENIAQLAFVFQQGQKNLSKFEFFQLLATKFIESKGFPIALIAQIKTVDTLSFFTPALQLNDNFNKTNHQQRNALHCLFAGEQSVESNTQPPFNYLRSMMLFESNKTLRDALCQRDEQNLSPVEVYLFANKNLSAMPTHEFTALLALIEIQSKQQSVDDTNYFLVIQAIGELCRRQVQLISNELQRLILVATYYSKPIENVLYQLK